MARLRAAAPGALLVLLAVLLRLPSRHQVLDRDSALYAVIGREAGFDTLPYRDLFDHKPPLVHLVYKAVDLVAGDRLTPIRLLAAVVAGLTAAVLFYGLRRVAGRARAIAAALLLSVVSAAGVLQGMDLNTEHLLVLPATAAVLLPLAAGGRWVPAAAGACIGLAVLAKPVGALIALPALVALPDRRPRALVEFAAGAAAPVAVLVAVYAIAGALGDLVFAQLTYNVEYVGDYVEPYGRPLLPPEGARRLLILGGLAAAAVHLVRHRGRSRAGWVAATFVLATWAGAWFGGRGFPHYFATCAPAAALAVGLALEPGRGRSALAPLAAGAIAAVLAGQFGADIVKRFGQTNNEIAIDIYGPDANEWIAARPLSDAIRAAADPGDRLFVTGAQPIYYWYTELEPASRHLFDYPALLFPERFERDIAANLCGAPPRFIVFSGSEVPEYMPPCLDDRYVDLARNDFAVAVVRR